MLNRDIIDTYLDILPELLSSESPKERSKFTTRVTPPDDDREHVYEVHIGLLPYDEEFQGAAGVVRDITEKVDRQAQLERENERLEEFASVVSHDLRNPLNVVQGYLEMFEETRDPEHLGRIRQATERMEELIDDLLMLARQGESIETATTVNLEQAVETCWETVESTATTLRVDTDCAVQADSSRLRQLLENLFRNAVEHHPLSL